MPADDEAQPKNRADADLCAVDYKFNLDLGGGIDLRQWWENLLAFFLEEPE